GQDFLRNGHEQGRKRMRAGPACSTECARSREELAHSTLSVLPATRLRLRYRVVATRPWHTHRIKCTPVERAQIAWRPLRDTLKVGGTPLAFVLGAAGASGRVAAYAMAPAATVVARNLVAQARSYPTTLDAGVWTQYCTPFACLY